MFPDYANGLHIAYGTYFFEMANVGDAFENSCILTAVGVVAIMANIAVVTRVGRRRLFLTAGLILCGFSQVIVAAVYTVHPGTQSTGRAIVGLSVIFIVGYNVSILNVAVVSGLSNGSNSDTGNDLNICLGIRWGTSVSTSAIVYLWICIGNRILGSGMSFDSKQWIAAITDPCLSVADYIHRTILYQP
jgi:hypothetical protein